MNVINALIEKYKTESSVPLRNDQNIYSDLMIYLEPEEDFQVFNRWGFDMATEYNFQAYNGFENKYIALISEDTLYSKLVTELLERGLLIEYLEGFSRDWTTEYFDDHFEEATSYTEVYENGEVTLKGTQSATISFDDILNEIKEENLLNSLCRFLDKESLCHWSKGWYQDLSYTREAIDDPRQLKLFVN
jgi:hypothetical protein